MQCKLKLRFSKNLFFNFKSLRCCNKYLFRQILFKMNSLKCEFCAYVSFSNKANKRRHFLAKHNFAFYKAKSYIPDGGQDIPAERSTAEITTKEDDDIYKKFMEEDDEFLLNIKF